MAMVLANNMSAVNTLNILRKNVGRQEKDMAKLSTGMKINNAGDDTSGYSISERMRAQIRGLNSCSDNVKTGFNMLSTAAEAVGCQLDILKKMREATLKASDDTYSQKDRDVLAIEADELFNQLDLIAEETTYNGKYLLNLRTGTTKSTTHISQEKVYTFSPRDLPIDNTKIGTIFDNSNSQYYSHTASSLWQTIFNQTPITGLTPNHPSSQPNYSMATLDFSTALAGKQIEDFDGQGFSILCDGCGQFSSVVFDTNMPLGSGERQAPTFDPPGPNDSYLNICRQYVIGLKGAKNADDIANAVYNGVIDANTKYDGTSSTIMGKHVLQVQKQGNKILIGTTNSANFPVFYEGIKGASSTTEVTAHTKVLAGCEPWEDKYIQSGTKAGEKTAIRLWNTSLEALFPPADTKFLLEPDEYPTEFNEADYPDPQQYPERYEGYVGTDLEKKQQLWRDTTWPYTKAGAQQNGEALRTREGAARFLDDLDQAIKYVLHVQTDFGSQMMRMEIADTNIVISRTSTTASESTIRDADMAQEMTNFTRDNLLAQAAQSMLAQANQSSSNVLTLLQ